MLIAPDPANRSPLQGLLACLVAAAVSGWYGHWGIALLALGCAMLSARRLEAMRRLRPRPSRLPGLLR